MARDPYRRHRPDRTRPDDLGWLVAVGGTITTFALAGLLEPARRQVGATNIALLLALVVVVAAVLGRRRGGVTTALTAAMTYNFFHTRPVHTLRIASARDVGTVLLLGLLGVMVGELAERRHVDARGSRVGHAELGLLHADAETAVNARSSSDVLFDATATVAALLGAEAVRFERETGAGVPTRRTILHNGTLDGIPLRASVTGYDLGGDPVALEVAARGRRFGHLIVHPTAGRPVSLDERLGAVVAADHLALALASLDAAAPAIG